MRLTCTLVVVLLNTLSNPGTLTCTLTVLLVISLEKAYMYFDYIAVGYFGKANTYLTRIAIDNSWYRIAIYYSE